MVAEAVKGRAIIEKDTELAAALNGMGVDYNRMWLAAKFLYRGLTDTLNIELNDSNARARIQTTPHRMEAEYLEVARSLIKRPKLVALPKKLRISSPRGIQDFYKSGKTVRGTFLFIRFLKQIVFELYQKEDLAHQKAFDHFNSLKVHHRPSYTFPSLVEFFRRYEEAKKLGKKVSLEKLCKGLTGLYHVMAVRILHSLKLEPLYENYPRQPRQFYYNQKRLIPKLVRMRMSYPDMSYFLDISYSMLIKQVRKMGIKSKAGSITGIGYKHRSYQLASQIYEAKAAGFRKYSDIAELLDTSREIVKDAFDNKKIIAPPIIRVLRIRYNDPDYNKPYKKPQES